MSEGPPKAGRINGPITRHAPLDRPSVVVTVGGVEHAGREHARAMDGQAVLVHWGADYRWVRARDVRPVDDEDATSPATTDSETD